MLDVDALLQPISEDSACGSDLEYDAGFLALEEAARGKPERQVGDAVIAAEPPEWRSVFPDAISLFTRTKDIRVACTLLRSATVLHGLEGLVSGLTLIDALFERYWTGVFPLLDADDGDDPTMRLNALAPLTDETGFLADLGNANFATARGLGSVSIREALEALGLIDAGESGSPVTVAQVEGILHAMLSEQGAAEGNLARQALDCARSIETRVRELTGSYAAISLQTLTDRLSAIADMVDRVQASLAPATAQGEASGEADDGVPVAMSGEVLTREQALRALDKVCQFLERTEPANPAPLLIRRAQRLMTMSFIEIMRDMAPDALGPVQNIAGLRDQDLE